MPGGGGRGGAPGATPSGYICVDKYGKRFMSENQPSRHGFGQKEYLMFFDGINGTLSRIPCYYIFDETTRTRSPIGPSGGGGRGGGPGGGGMGWFSNHPTYQWSRDNSAEIEKGWITKGETVADLATKLGMKELEATLTKYNENEGEKDIREIDIIKDQKSEDPLTEAQKRDLKSLLTKGLTRAERLIVVLYYYEEMTMKEIGATLDLSESRVSQMHSSIIARLKAQMNTRKKEFAVE
ncbi:MAG: sigma-70 family RNA polymerase sigma factor [Sedimentisphaerales bacterium]